MAADGGILSGRVSFVGRPLPVSRGETGETCCERADWEIGFTDLILSAVRFQFREAKLARIVVERGGLGNWFYRFNFSTARFQFREAKLAR